MDFELLVSFLATITVEHSVNLVEIEYGVAFVSKIKIDLLGKIDWKNARSAAKFQSKLRSQQIDLQHAHQKLQ